MRYVGEARVNLAVNNEDDDALTATADVLLGQDARRRPPETAA